MLEKKKIMVVEDEAIHAMYLKIMLKNNGFVVSGTVSTAESAIECIEVDRPDLVLMDITLRNSIDGIELTNILRENYNFPVIFISGYDDKETLSRIKAIDSSWKLVKPLDENRLIRLINEIFSNSEKVTN